jgi:hypothetical protein
MTRRVVYVLQTKANGMDRPSVFIEVTKDGSHVYGVRASGSNLRVARERAQVEFFKLAEFVSGLK